MGFTSDTGGLSSRTSSAPALAPGQVFVFRLLEARGRSSGHTAVALAPDSECMMNAQTAFDFLVVVAWPSYSRHPRPGKTTRAGSRGTLKPRSKLSGKATSPPPSVSSRSFPACCRRWPRCTAISAWRITFTNSAWRLWRFEEALSSKPDWVGHDFSGMRYELSKTAQATKFLNAPSNCQVIAGHTWRPQYARTLEFGEAADHF